MSNRLHILSAGPSVTVQDQGRIGYLAQGLSRGGAADKRALFEGAALLGQCDRLAALELMGMGGTFRVDQDTRIALTGAEMPAAIDGARIVWNASNLLPKGATLSIGGAREGTYGYLHLGGGLDVSEQMGARATHLNAGIGAALQAGESLPIGQDNGAGVQNALPKDPRFNGGTVHFVASLQTDQFGEETLARFTNTTFRRDARANRMGVRMDHEGAGFFAADQLNILSEVIVPGDIQLAGDGAPYVLMSECQTTGGYPRIGSVIPSDIPRVAQAPAGAEIRFRLVSLEEATELEQRAQAAIKALPSHVFPLIRDPHDIRDLLGYQLAGDAVSATANPFKSGEQS